MNGIWPAATPDRELDRYVKKNALSALLLLLALFVVLGVVGVLYEEQLLAATHAMHERLGLFGLGAILFVTDAVISPIPPDVVLVVVAKSALAKDWLWLVPAAGALSAVAGSVAWTIGRRLGESDLWIARWVRARRLERALVQRHGRWAVALGALTPIPFSVTCWIAGMCGMRYRDFAPVTLLRIPRFVIYYVAIAYADTALRAFF